MIETPLSLRYRFEKLAAENDLTQSWVAVDRDIGRKCFVKVPSSIGSLSKSEKISFLKTSYRCQKRLRSREVLRASAQHRENRTIFIEYPYLDDSEWQVVDSRILADHFAAILIEMAVTVDYMHLLGLIHGDAKLDNFLVSLSSSQPKLVLADLDFLRPEGQKLTAKVFGTPDFIAPEVLANENISGLSDNYSLGLSLKSHSESVPERGSGESGYGAGHREKLQELVAGLTADDPSERPRFLVDALCDCGIIDDSTLRTLNRRLLSMELLANYCTHLNRRSAGQRRFNRFLIETNKVHGVPEEFLDDLEDVHKRERSGAFRLASKLVADARVERYSDYWYVSLSDDQLEKAYSSLGELGMSADKLPDCFASEFSRGDFTESKRRVDSLREQGYHLKAFISLRTAERQMRSYGDKVDRETGADLYSDMADAVAALGRTEEASRYYELASSLAEADSTLFYEMLREAAFQCLVSGRIQHASELIELGLAKPEQPWSRNHRNELKRLRAWITAAEGRLEESERAVSALLQEAIERDDKLPQVRIYNDLGTRYWREGDFAKAEKFYRKSIEIAVDENLLPEAVSPFANMSMLCYEILEYRRSVKYAKLALKSLVRPTDFTKLAHIYRTIMVSYVRLGEFQKAQYWHQRYFPGTSPESGETYFGNFLQDSGWIHLTKGELSEAKDNLYRAIDLLGKLRTERTLGKAHFVSATIALYRSDSEAFAYHLSKAKSVFEELGDQTSLADLEYLDALNRIYNDESESKRALIPVAETLGRHRSYNLACEALFHLYVDDTPTIDEFDYEKIRPLIARISRSRAPLCRAVGELIAFHDVPQSERLRNLRLLKSAYKTLEDYGQTYLMMLISKRIAKCYLDASRESLAKKFLLNAQRLAEKRIGNQVVGGALRVQIEAISQHRSEKRKMVHTILSISTILQDIRDYDETLNALIQYAVDVTGAERGALLLRRVDSADFQAKAYLNCDDESLRDIVDFSRNVARSVVESEHPLIVDNALDDKRTKGYKSIVAHNILSVICIPVYKADEVLGVLYLDHHTIPALFTDEDIEFIRAMANFLSHIITMARDFKTASVVTQEYLNDLRVTGTHHQQLITQNSTMLSLLKELPQIARSDASVLIVGESGTGKEILCELTHALSNRSDQPLVKLNCAAIPSHEIESELFGVAKNAFTGVSEREGKFSAADGGTMFLDEIADMPLAIQGKVLRVLEYQEFEKRGSNRTITTDVRFVYATNKRLPELVSQGVFREDLFHRVNRIVIEIPPLRERLDDIPLLIEHFANLFSPGKRSATTFTPEAIEALMHHRWPGNVRELKNLVESFCILKPGRTIGINELPRTMLDSISDPKESKEVSRSLEKALIRRLLEENNGIKSRVAKILGIPLSTLRRRIKLYGLEN